jgi:NAD(P)H-dependent FMN reductase
MDTLKIAIIMGSTREGRFSERPAGWVLGRLSKQEGVEAELLDLRDFPMPFYDSVATPKAAKGVYSNEIAQKWAEKIKQVDGFIIVTPEYNHGYPAVLKNALDWIYQEWNNKPVGFVAYGSVGGARSVEQLRQVAVELEMLPLRNGVHISWDAYTAIKEAPQPVDPKVFESLDWALDTLISELIPKTKVLKTLRNS